MTTLEDSHYQIKKWLKFLVNPNTKTRFHVLGLVGTRTTHDQQDVETQGTAQNHIQRAHQLFCFLNLEQNFITNLWRYYILAWNLHLNSILTTRELVVAY